MESAAMILRIAAIMPSSLPIYHEKPNKSALALIVMCGAHRVGHLVAGHGSLSRTRPDVFWAILTQREDGIPLTLRIWSSAALRTFGSGL